MVSGAGGLAHLFFAVAHVAKRVAKEAQGALLGVGDGSLFRVANNFAPIPSLHGVVANVFVTHAGAAGGPDASDGRHFDLPVALLISLAVVDGEAGESAAPAVVAENLVSALEHVGGLHIGDARAARTGARRQLLGRNGFAQHGLYIARWSIALQFHDAFAAPVENGSTSLVL